MMTRRILTATALLVLTPLIPALSGDKAEASDSRVYVSGGISVVAPDFVLGFSYNDPYVLGHVHHEPVYCDHGPLYYYPHYRVYGHYYPRYAYSYYARPYIRYVGPPRYGHAHHVRGGHPGHGGRHHVYSHPGRGKGHDRHYYRSGRDDHRGNDRDDRRGGRQGKRVRGH